MPISPGSVRVWPFEDTIGVLRQEEFFTRVLWSAEAKKEVVHVMNEPLCVSWVRVSQQFCFPGLVLMAEGCVEEDREVIKPDLSRCRELLLVHVDRQLGFVVGIVIFDPFLESVVKF